MSPWLFNVFMDRFGLTTAYKRYNKTKFLKENNSIKLLNSTCLVNMEFKTLERIKQEEKHRIIKKLIKIILCHFIQTKFN